MFTQKITESDAFLEMPPSSQNFYFHLCMYADDDGFVNSPKKIQKFVGATDDDARILIAKNFIIPFESGVMVIKHWRMHNQLRKDRYHPTDYYEEKCRLYLKSDGAYTLDETQGQKLVATTWQPNGNQMAPEYRIGKDSIGENNIDDIARTPARDFDEEYFADDLKFFCDKYGIAIDDYNCHLSELDFKALDKAYSGSKWLRENFTVMSKICKHYLKIISSAYKDKSEPVKQSSQFSQNERHYTDEDLSAMITDIDDFEP